MTSPALIRPPRVTTACLFFGTICLLTLFQAGSALANWGSLEVQDGIRSALEGESLKSLDLTVDDVLGWLRVLLIGMCAIAAAGIVFAIYTAKGHQPSRVIMTALLGLSSLLFLFVGILGIIPAAFSIFCAIYLWTAEAQRWFAVKNGKIAAPAVDARPNAFAEAPPAPAASPDAQTVAQPAVQPGVHQGQGQVAAVAAPRPPSAVQAAGLVTLIGSSITFLLSGVALLVFLTTSRAEILRAYDDSPTWQRWGVSEAEISDAIDNSIIICAVAAVLSALAIVAAIALLLNKKAGRIATLVLACITVPFGVLSIVGLPWAIAAAVVVYLLQKAEVRSWFAASR